LVNSRAFVVFLWGCLIATAAVAGEEHKTVIKIAVDDEAGAQKEFSWHSDDADLDLEGLEVGESKTMNDDDGNEVTVTRTEKGLEFDVDGEKIELMDFDGDANIVVDVLRGDGKDVVIHANGDHEQVIVNKHKNVKIIKARDHHDVTIISAKEIDDEARAKIKEVLGDEDVMFIDGSELDGDEQVHEKHEVRIIKKKD